MTNQQIIDFIKQAMAEEDTFMRNLLLEAVLTELVFRSIDGR
jgi:hypothetical protein